MASTLGNITLISIYNVQEIISALLSAEMICLKRISLLVFENLRTRDLLSFKKQVYEVFDSESDINYMQFMSHDFYEPKIYVQLSSIVTTKHMIYYETHSNFHF